MAESWIGGYMYFMNISFPFDPLEPYSTIGTLVVGIPTFIIATYVYIIVLRASFRGAAYFHIFIGQGIIDLLAFLTNLLRYRLAMFETFASFYASLSDSAWATALCTTAISMPRAQLVAQCLLSTNRLFAIMKPMEYNKLVMALIIAHMTGSFMLDSVFQWQSTFSRCGFLLLIFVPALVAIPDILNGYYFAALYGTHGTITFFSSAQLGRPELIKARQIMDGIATAFHFSLTLFALLCNCALIVLVATKKGAMKAVGRGLLITTLTQFLTHLAYAMIMVCYLYLPQPFSNASMFTTIALDAISILPIWLLLAFSSAVREAVLQTIPGRRKKAGTSNTERRTVTVIGTVALA